MDPASAVLLFGGSSGLIPLAGLSLSIPFLGNQQQGKDNIYGGINYGPSGESNTLNFQDLINTMRKNPKIPFLNFGKKDEFTENFLKEGINDTSGTILKSDSLVGNKPETEFLGGEVKKTELLNADGSPITNTSSTTSSTTSPNNNKNNDNKDGNNVNKLLYGSFLAGPLFEGGKYLFNQAKNIFGKDDTDEDDGKSDFEDMTGITYEKAMELQRKRENELMNRRALEGGIKDAGKYMYLAGAAGMEAGKNIGRNTQDMLRSMAYGQSALANTIAGAAKTAPLTRTYFS
jgi:hypothetical protein